METSAFFSTRTTWNLQDYQFPSSPNLFQISWLHHVHPWNTNGHCYKCYLKPLDINHETLGVPVLKRTISWKWQRWPTTHLHGMGLPSNGVRWAIVPIIDLKKRLMAEDVIDHGSKVSKNHEDWCHDICLSLRSVGQWLSDEFFLPPKSVFWCPFRSCLRHLPASLNLKKTTPTTCRRFPAVNGQPLHRLEQLVLRIEVINLNWLDQLCWSKTKRLIGSYIGSFWILYHPMLIALENTEMIKNLKDRMSNVSNKKNCSNKSVVLVGCWVFDIADLFDVVVHIVLCEAWTHLRLKNGPACWGCNQGPKHWKIRTKTTENDGLSKQFKNCGLLNNWYVYQWFVCVFLHFLEGLLKNVADWTCTNLIPGMFLMDTSRFLGQKKLEMHGVWWLHHQT